MANPIAMLLTSAKMMEHLGLQKHGEKIKEAIKRVLEEGNVKTRDLGGFATTTQMTAAVVQNL